MAEQRLDRFEPFLSYMNGLMATNPGHDKDLECYLVVSDLLQFAEKVGGERISIHDEGQACNFIDRFAAILPCTTASIAGHLSTSRSIRWLEPMVNRLIEDGVQYDYQVIAISSMLSRLKHRITYGRGFYNQGLLTLCSMCYGALDKVTFESDQQKAEIEQSLKDSFRVIELVSGSFLSYSILNKMAMDYGKERMGSLVREILDPMSRLHEETCSIRVNYGKDIGVLGLMTTRLDMTRDSGNEYGARLYDYNVALTNVLNTLSVPGPAWPSILKADKPAHRTETVALEMKALIKTIKTGTPDPLPIRNALTAFSKFALEAAFANKSSVQGSNELLMSVLLPEVDLPELLSSLKPGAKRMISSYVAQTRPDLLHHLGLAAKGEALENQLGL